MSKVYKGYELLKAIADGEIKEGSRFIDNYNEYIYRKDGIEAELTLYKIDTITGEYYTPDYSYFADNENEFELIEDETIDIDNIEEFKSMYTMNSIEFQIKDKLNELVQAVKQLNKEIKSIKEK